jgi:alanine dehydrogenase
MLIGVPKEIKPQEFRVAITPAGVESLTEAGHRVLVEKGAGIASGFTDSFYQGAGAEIIDGPEQVWARAEMIMKVKEPIEVEWPRMRSGQVIFTYFHFAASRPLTEAVLASGAVAVAYETVELASGELPLLTPMSEVAGRMAVQEGAKYLERHSGGSGVLLSGVPGVMPGKVLILGGGVVGTNAARIAAGIGARVAIMDVSLPRLRHLEDVMPPNVTLLFSTRYAIRKQIEDSDLIIGAVLIPGRKAPNLPNLVTRDDLKRMRPGSVIVDVAVDQGGCVETIRPTTHDDPIYVVDNVIHYGVTNMPGGVPRTSTLALTNATLPYALKLAESGWRGASLEDKALACGVNVVEGTITHPGVAEAFGMEWSSLERFLEGTARV